MIASPNTFRVPLQNGAAHFGQGYLCLRRFRSDHGVASFVLCGEKSISALLELEAILSKGGNRIAEPSYHLLPNDYVVYLAPSRKRGLPSVTLALEPKGLPEGNVPFSLSLLELKRIAGEIRTALNEEVE